MEILSYSERDVITVIFPIGNPTKRASMGAVPAPGWIVWLNLVEVWFSHLTTAQLQRGDFLSVHDLIDAIYAYIHNRNQAACPFIWTAPAERILDKVMKCRAVSESLH